MDQRVKESSLDPVTLAATTAAGTVTTPARTTMGVFSSGVFDVRESSQWEEKHRAKLDDAAAKRGLSLVWFSTGKDDFLADTTAATVGLLEKHGFTVTSEPSAGGHTWINWRHYLNDLVPQLFATAGAGMRNEFNEPNVALENLLGVKQRELFIATNQPIAFDDFLASAEMRDTELPMKVDHAEDMIVLLCTEDSPCRN